MFSHEGSKGSEARKSRATFAGFASFVRCFDSPVGDRRYFASGSTLFFRSVQSVLGARGSRP